MNLLARQLFNLTHPITFQNFRYFAHVGPDLIQIENRNDLRSTEIIYGIHPVSLALVAKRRKFKQVFYRKDVVDRNPRLAEILKSCDRLGIKVRALTKSKIDSLNTGKLHQGICAEVTPLKFTSFNLDELEKLCKKGGKQTDKPLFWLFLHEIQDPMNLGSIVRSAYFFGVDKIFVPESNCCSLTPTVSKASSGVVEIIDIHSINTPDLLQPLLRENWNILGTCGHSEKNPSSSIPMLPLNQYEGLRSSVLILGNEGSGLPASVTSLCTHLISVPPGRELHPGVDSMNVSAAAAVLIHSIAWKTKR